VSLLFTPWKTAHRAVATAVSASDLPAGSAKGSLTYDGATAELKFAAAFIDQEDQDKPIVLVISHQKLPMEKWIREGFLLLPSSSLARRSLARGQLTFLRRGISRYGQTNLSFACSQHKKSSTLLSLCKAC